MVRPKLSMPSYVSELRNAPQATTNTGTEVNTEVPAAPTGSRGDHGNAQVTELPFQRAGVSKDKDKSKRAVVRSEKWPEKGLVSSSVPLLSDKNSKGGSARVRHLIQKNSAANASGKSQRMIDDVDASGRKKPSSESETESRPEGKAATSEQEVLGDGQRGSRPLNELDTKFDFDYINKGRGTHIEDDARACADYLGKSKGSYRDILPIDTFIETGAYQNCASTAVQVCVYSFIFLSCFFFLVGANISFDQMVSASNPLID